MRTTFVLLMLSVAACKGGDKPATPPAGSAAPPTPAAKPIDKGFCRYEMTGGLEGKGASVGDETTLGADYYNDKPIDPAKKPMILFSTVCLGPPAQINFFPNAGMGYADVPFAPGEYKIANGAKDIGASVSKSGGFLQPGVSGSFTITRFDAKGMAGTFEFDTEASTLNKDEKPVHVKGEFDLPCLLPTKICQDARR